MTKKKNRFSWKKWEETNKRCGIKGCREGAIKEIYQFGGLLRCQRHKKIARHKEEYPK